jgi:hypothetical protein
MGLVSKCVANSSFSPLNPWIVAVIYSQYYWNSDREGDF